MPDYGVPLQFGIFITSTNRSPHAPVALGQFRDNFNVVEDERVVAR